MRKLPEDFLQDMKEIFKDEKEYEDFLSSYEKNSSYGLRLNPLQTGEFAGYGETPAGTDDDEKGDCLKESFKDKFTEINSVNEKCLSALPYTLKKIPWCSSGYSAVKLESPGKSVYHEAGLFYIQEPSAMVPAALLHPLPGENVLDLCAAPGGKTTQIAGYMKDTGLLVANEPVKKRAEILYRNTERMGISCATVTNETPERLAERFPGKFDCVLVDAPCSGEGMFRKDEEAVNEWSRENVIMCAGRQKTILESAVRLLKDGGRLVYSTCTFSVEEDEKIVEWLLASFPDLVPGNWEEEAVKEGGQAYLNEILKDGVSHGISERPDIRKCTVRMWPHRINGEGHFAALLLKGENPVRENRLNRLNYRIKNDLNLQKQVTAFLDENFSSYNRNIFRNRALVTFGDRVFLLPAGVTQDSIKSLKVQSPGVCVGTLKKNRFEPDHYLAKAAASLGLCPLRTVDTSYEEALNYLRGQEINAEPDLKGWCIVSFHGMNLGWGKAVRGRVKNHYPKGLRI